MNNEMINKIPLSDYSLIGKDSSLAIEKGLANAKWYVSPVPREKMRELLERKDGPAIRDTLLWLVLLFFFGACGFILWGSWWAIFPFAVYGVLYASVSDSRWHESSHGTAFKTDWMNNALYELASFMVIRESVRWRWSHTRHHSDTIIVGRDPEIAVPRPFKLGVFILNFFNVFAFRMYWSNVLLHCTGKVTADERTYIPETEYPKLFIRARIYVLIYLGIIGLSIYSGSILPLLYIGLSSFYGGWLMPVYGNTQHAGLAENVLDHRLNCRTVYMHAVNRYLYWNMNYHVEHHMFPLVPYHALPKLHELIKADVPPAYNGLRAAYSEIIPALMRQAKDPTYFVKRQLPESALALSLSDVSSNDKAALAAGTSQVIKTECKHLANGWIEICPSSQIRKEEVLRFDHNHQNLCPLLRPEWEFLRNRWPLHPWKRTSGRWYDKGNDYRMCQAQRTF